MSALLLSILLREGFEELFIVKAVTVAICAGGWILVGIKMRKIDLLRLLWRGASLMDRKRL